MDTIRFEDLDLKPQILRGIKHMGFEYASPIQAKAIPVALEGKDLVGQAQTGTGKTAAFGIPVLQAIDPDVKKVQSLILCPTRELAIQVAEEIRKLSFYMHGVKVLPIYGGQEITRQIKSLRGVQIVVGTPGRVMDHMRRHTLKFQDLKVMVLDEADEMLNMGFREDIETILEKMPEERQTLLFSATMPKPILDITKNYQKDATMIKIIRKEVTGQNIEQYYFDIMKKYKKDTLYRLLDFYNPKLSVIFCNTKKMADELADDLKQEGYTAEALHGDLSQAQRDRVMKGFRSGSIRILVATDVAARGIDVDDVDIVFNYDLPQDNEYYVHRIGRTGRAGRTGMALSLVTSKDYRKLREISQYAKTKIKRKRVPSATNVMEAKAAKVFQEVEEAVSNQDLTKYIVMIEEMSQDKDYSPIEIAAALLKEKIGDNQERPERNFETEKEEKRFSSRKLKKGGREKGMSRLFLNIGKKQKIRPGDILGAVAGEAKIAGNLVGAIDMFDKFSFVEVPAHLAEDVLHAMKKVKIKGKSIRVELANDKEASHKR